VSRQETEFAKKSLFFRSQEYRLSDLQAFLHSFNIQTLIIDKGLNYDDRVFLYFDEQGDIRLEGFVSEEYYAIRTLIYSHFGRISYAGKGSA